MSFLAELLAETLFALGRKAAQFSRKKSEREFLEEIATWDRPHMNARKPGDTCLICGLAVLKPDDPCPGPPAAQAARLKLGRAATLPAPKKPPKAR